MEKNKKLWILVIVGAIASITSVPLIYPYCINNSNIQLYMETIPFADISEGFLLIPKVLFHLFDSVENAYKVYVLIINFASAGIVFWSLKKIFNKMDLALLGTMLYNFAPYRINSIYIKGDLGEAFALAFIPLVFSTLYLIVKEKKEETNYTKLTALLIIAYTCVLQNDVLTFLISATITIVLLLVFWKQVARKDVLFTLLQTIIGVIVLNFYLVISLGKAISNNGIDYLFNDSFIQKRGVYFLHYIIPYFKSGTNNDFSTVGFGNTQPLGMGFAITVCMILYLWILFSKNQGKTNDDVFKWANYLAILGTINIVLSSNSFPWDYFQKIFPRLISIVYSPTRFIPFAIVCFTLVSCVVMYKLKLDNRVRYSIAMIMLVSLSLLLTIYLISDIMLMGEIYTPGLSEEKIDLSPLDYLKYIN